jgi:hypothetical protein
MLLHGVVSFGVSPPSRLVALAGDYTTLNFNHSCDGTLGRLDLLNDYKHPLDALERLGPEWEKAVRDVHISGWRR